jgi:hypothetical protein
MVDQIDTLKDYLADPTKVIKLHDAYALLTKELVSQANDERFDVSLTADNALFVERMHQYERIVEKLLAAELLIGRWGQGNQAEIATMPLRRLAEAIQTKGGTTSLLQARWYPVYLLLYAGCIGATAGHNYEAIVSITHATAPNLYGAKNRDTLLTAVTAAMTDIHDMFQLFPGMERKRSPRSDHLFDLIRPYADDTLYLSSDYESIFDRTETILFIEYMHLDHPEPIADNERVWGPAGRFISKNTYVSPLSAIVAEATAAGHKWPPSRAGLFGGSTERFVELAKCGARLLSQSGW